ncbi:hypothetical protein COCCADRAFT_110011 [Bipolaris zeicola 26-R-13]|uniref:Wax synthase domain-containing protein n=1 Tax=Cochliobolus carbonum (strain 26-R-13) TaxID=930089 RepID=W6XLH7_COCC2|nr:uncharacterized protein COCCADRAFT_110011 [Bipolaris zeicola 26-R-13]EUC28107.1 hypothetical protein COCCADRAFT_110011 [Bipolaris zeicola 26-R-13]
MAVSLQLPPIFLYLQFPIMILNNAVALALRPERQFLCVSITLPILVVFAAQSLYRELDTSWGYKYGMETLTTCLVYHYIGWVLLGVPDKEGWYKIQYGKGNEHEKKKDKMTNGKMNGNGVPANKKYQYVPGGAGTTFWSRLWWAMRLSCTNRYVGWSQQVKGVIMEVPSDYPRLRFIVEKLVHGFIYWAISDILTAYTATSPYGTYIDLQRSNVKPYQPFAPDAPFWGVRFWYTWVHILITRCTLAVCFAISGIFAVALGLANPRDCPSAFGLVRDLWSVRQAWSLVWHQQLRFICSAPAIWLARDVFRFPKGSFGSRYVQLFVTFANSWIIHSVAAMLVNQAWTDDGGFVFFMSQAVIILVEDHLIALGKKMGFRDNWMWRVVGLVWTVIMVGWPAEYWVSRHISYGIWVHQRSPDLLGIGPK